MSTQKTIACGRYVPTLLVTLFFAGCSDATRSVSQIEHPPVLQVVATSNDQTGVAGFPLGVPLQVQVLVDGVAKSGVAVKWSSTAGVVAPNSTVSDIAGFVTARWTLGTAVGAQTATAFVESTTGAVVQFRAVAVEQIRVEAVSESDGQHAAVGTTLSKPLRVLVTRNGVPVVGASVIWSAVSGSITASSRSDASGIASATWIMSTSAGSALAFADIPGSTNGMVRFTVIADPGPVTTLEAAISAIQITPINRPLTSPLVVRANDQYGNAIARAPVQWSVISGSAALSKVDSLTQINGLSYATAVTTGKEGSVVVQATLQARTVQFTLRFDPPEWLILLHTNSSQTQFSSVQNNSIPAVDTLSVGQTIIWRLAPFDYDLHVVEVGGTPPLYSFEFPYAEPSDVRFTFSTKGTFQYRDVYSRATGTVVVR